jgi:hypothetical protein
MMASRLCTQKESSDDQLLPLEIGLVVQQKILSNAVRGANNEHLSEVSSEITFRVKSEIGRGHRANTANALRDNQRPSFSAMYDHQFEGRTRFGSNGCLATSNIRPSETRDTLDVCRELEDFQLADSFSKKPLVDVGNHCLAAVEQEQSQSITEQSESHDNEMVSFRSKVSYFLSLIHMSFKVDHNECRKKTAIEKFSDTPEFKGDNLDLDSLRKELPKKKLHQTNIIKGEKREVFRELHFPICRAETPSRKFGYNAVKERLTTNSKLSDNKENCPIFARKPTKVRPRSASVLFAPWLRGNF